MIVATLGMIGAVIAGGLALGQDFSEALAWGVLILLPVVIGAVSGRRQRQDRERVVVGGLSPAQQEAALTAYAGRTQTSDPVVAHDAVRLILSVSGDAMAYSRVVGIAAVGVALGLAVLAIFSSRWWAVDAVLVAAFGIFLARQTSRLRSRVVRLREIEARSRVSPPF